MSELDDFRRDVVTPEGARKFTLILQSMFGMVKALENFSVSFLDLHTNNAYSGTVIRLGDRVFVATAGHAIPNDPVGRLWIVRRIPRSASDGFPGFLKWRRHPNEEIDAGYLEADPGTLIEYLGHDDFSTIDNLADFGTGRENRGVIVVGSPSKKIQHFTDGVKTHLMAFEAMPYATPLYGPKHWPEVDPRDRAPDTEIDVFLNYPRESLDVQPNAATSISAVPDPGGMSGGGVWDQGFVEGKLLWTPRDCKLFAIQSSWEEERRYLRATQIRHWIDLIREDYPDLQDALSSVRIEK
jgi:hypothetical protein